MTTYSTKSFVPVIPGPEPFTLSDVYVLSGVVPTHEEVMASIEVDPTEPWLSFTGVMDAITEAPETHAEARADHPPVPVRYVLLVFLGLVLMGIGLVREWLGLWIWAVIHG